MLGRVARPPFVPGGLVDQTREERALRERQLRRRLAEVRMRSGLDAVDAAAEVDRVQVHLEDLALGVLTFDLPRDARFLDLAGQRPGGTWEIQVLRQLLRDRRPALEL